MAQCSLKISIAQMVSYSGWRNRITQAQLTTNDRTVYIKIPRIPVTPEKPMATPNTAPTICLNTNKISDISSLLISPQEETAFLNKLVFVDIFNQISQNLIDILSDLLLSSMYILYLAYQLKLKTSQIYQQFTEMKEIKQNNILNPQNLNKVDLLLDEQMKGYHRNLQNSKKSKLNKKIMKINIKGKKKAISIHDFLYIQCVQLSRVHAGITRQNQAPLKRYCCQYCCKNFENSKKLGGHITSCRKRFEKNRKDSHAQQKPYNLAKKNVEELDSTQRYANQKIQNCKPSKQKSQLDCLQSTKPQECQSIFNNANDLPPQSNEYQSLDSFFF